MSIRVRNIVVSNPSMFSQNGGFGFYLDAPPHITELRLKMVFTGVRTETIGTVTRTETLDYTKEKTFTRVGIKRDSSEAGIYPSESFEAPDILATLDLAPIDPDEFRIFNLHWGNFETFVSPQMARAPVDMFYVTDFTPEVAGTWSYEDSANPLDDDSGDIMISSWPDLAFNQEPGMDEYREPMTRWGSFDFEIPYYGFGSTLPPSPDPNYIDVSVWDYLEWRSKIGIYSYTLTETGFRTSGTSSAEGTLEWELS